LPNLKGVIFIVVLLRGVWMFNKFDIIFVLTRGGPGGATTTTPIHAYNTMFGTGNIGETAVISVILFGMIATAAILYFWILEPSEEVRVE
jgi:multiple sugar transport system permease protein